MDKQQIITTLTPLYRLEYDIYDQLEALAKEAIQEGDMPAFEAISRRAVNKSHFLDGVKAAAKALGVDTAELMNAINSDKEAAQ
ncbi:MAG: hypothetical protein HFE97_12430 [Oscillospiraceae bacterium]|nr:hypothetical protein [Oscillospiraceae bacterium]MCI8914836.1 hypothetical protein [Lawsonibacter sp.]